MKNYIFLFGFCLLFTACGNPEQEQVNVQQSTTGSPLLKRIQESQTRVSEKEKTQTVSLELQKSQMPTQLGQEVVEIWLKNPEGLPLVSVRSFLAFDSKVFSGLKVELAPDSPFSITAPGESGFDPENGIVKIGLSAAGGQVVTTKELLIAKVSFERRANAFTTLDFYDIGDSGHTLVLAKIGDARYQNVLKAPSIPTLVFLEQ